MFEDTVNNSLPEFQRALGLKVNHSNLCSEITLPTNGERTAVCCLSSVNLEEYDEWKKQFVKITEAKQPQDADESLSSRKENEMSKETENFDLEEFAKKVAGETAAKIAMQQAEQKAAEKAEAEKAAEEAAAEAKAAAAAAAAKASTGTLPKGFSPPKPAEEPKPASRGTLPKGF